MAESKSLAVITKNISDNVLTRIQEYENRGQLNLPANYSVGNAVRSALLVLQETKTRDKKPVLEACTQVSIYNSLTKMIVLGLDPGKKQCDFIAHYDKLVCRPTYFGNEALVKRHAGVREVIPDVVYVNELQGFKVAKQGARTVIKEHDISSRFAKRKEKIDSTDDIAFAYCVLEFEDGRPDWVDIQDIEQIKQAWKQGEVYDNPKVDQSKIFHNKFTKDACIRTVINHACKRYINSSDDKSLEFKALKEISKEIAESQLEESLETANPIDIEEAVEKEETPEHDEQTGEVKDKPKREKKAKKIDDDFDDEITEEDLKQQGFDIEKDREAISRLDEQIGQGQFDIDN